MIKNPFKKLFQRKSAAEIKQVIEEEIKDALPVVKDRFWQASEIVQDGVRKVIPLREDTPETRYFKILGLSFVALIIIVLLTVPLSFLLTLRSPESVAVPQAVGQDLITAIEGVQEFGLIPRIEQQTFPDPASKGLVMQQNPAAGTSVRVGREVTLVVSSGASNDKVGNYVGRNFEEVRQEIRTLFSGDKPILQIADTSFTFDESEPGTIIAQEPEPGVSLSGSIQMKLLVSRGKDITAREVPAVLGLHWEKAVVDIMGADIPFSFALDAGNSGTTPGSVAAQEPPPAQTLKPGERLVVTMAAPETGAHQVFGLYESTLPDYAAGVDIMVSSLSSAGTSTVLYQFRHNGGKLSFPYLVDENSELVVSAFGKEIDRRLIKKN